MDWHRIATSATLISAAAGLGACSSSEQQNPPVKADCGAPPSGFLRIDEWAVIPRPPSVTGTIVTQLSIDREGTIKWEDEAVDQAELESRLGITKTLTPIPLVALDFPKGAPCTAIRTVHAAMEKHLICSTERVCLQGNWSEYRRQLTEKARAPVGN